MGRNTGSQIFWTHAETTTTPTHVITWYCQQHAKWEQRNAITPIGAIFQLEAEIEGHGCAEQ